MKNIRNFYQNAHRVAMSTYVKEMTYVKFLKYNKPSMETGNKK